MTGFDWFLIALLAFAAVRGFMRGLFVEMASFASLIIGIYLACKFTQIAAKAAYLYLDTNSELVPFFVFLVITLLVVLSLYLMAKVLQKILDAFALGGFVKVFGALFAILRTAFVLSLVFFFIAGLSPFKSYFAEREKDSEVYQHIVKLSPTFLPLQQWKTEVTAALSRG
jgi:membrane protein required for colicin V production